MGVDREKVKKGEEGGGRGRGRRKSEGWNGEVGILTHDMVWTFERRLIVSAMVNCIS